MSEKPNAGPRRSKVLRRTTRFGELAGAGGIRAARFEGFQSYLRPVPPWGGRKRGGENLRVALTGSNSSKEGQMNLCKVTVRYRFFVVPLFLLLACVGVFAQANSEITGIVTDQTGAVVAGATITLTDPATGATHTTTSGPTGLYDIPGLNPADYDLKIAATGFQTFVQTGVVIN